MTVSQPDSIETEWIDASLMDGRTLACGAVSRWRNYAEHLAPFQDTLAPFVRAFGYEPS